MARALVEGQSEAGNAGLVGVQCPLLHGPVLFRAAVCHCRMSRISTMEETNAIANQLDDLKGRCAALRGYL
jgi:hypothetical protein